MYKIYDLEKIKNEINSNVESIDVGMIEDWFWTGTTIYENDKFIEHIEKQLEDRTLMVAGICGSFWATPTMKIKYKNGEQKQLECYREIDKNRDLEITQEWDKKRAEIIKQVKEVLTNEN